jgi:hypothetical protein
MWKNSRRNGLRQDHTATRNRPRSCRLGSSRYVAFLWGPVAAILWVAGAAYLRRDTMKQACRMAMIVSTTEILFGVTPPHEWDYIYPTLAAMFIPPVSFLIGWGAFQPGRCRP